MKGFNFTTGCLREPRVHASTNIGRVKINTSVRKGLMYLLFFGAALWAAGLNAQTLQSNLWGTNGPVEVSVVNGNTIYIGGQFNYVGPTTGAGGALSIATGMPDTAFPKVVSSFGNYEILAVVPDGSGGWYIGGYFTSVGGTARNNIAHIRSDKTVDPSWNPNADNAVYALAVSGSTVYAGGGFLSIGGQARYRIAALNASTGSVTSWNPSPDNVVYALAVSGSTVYAGGQFTTIGGQTRNYIAAIYTSTGSATSWNPNVVGSAGAVNALAVSGSTVYAGGNFTSVGGQTRNGIAAIDTSTGSVTSWNPNATGAGIVNALAVSGSTVYAGGNFLHIGGQTRWHIAAIDMSTGNATSWNPKADSASGFYALAVSGSTIYAGGSFTHIGGQPRDRIAALDASTGSATSWDANASYTVFAIAVSGSTVYAGGNFTSIGGQTRNGIAALNASTGSATSWNPNSNISSDGNGNYGNVLALAVSGPTVYAGGIFNRIGGQVRYGSIAALDTSTGSATSWNPNNTKLLDSTNAVYALAVSGPTVYAGGSFIDIGGKTRWGIAALDASTGSVTNWNPHATGGVVFAIAVSGPTVYAGGTFTSIGGQTRKGIAKLYASADTNNATSWNPNLSGSVYAFAFSGSTVIVGGSFNSIGVQSRQEIGAIDTSAGLATSWNPGVGTTGQVKALAVSGSTVYVGGAFNYIGGQFRYGGIAALNASTGLATSWIPTTAGGSVNALALDFSNKTVYFGGNFTTIMNASTFYFAGLTDPADVALPAEIASISATPSLGGVKIQWKTASEVNLAGFDVLRSTSQNGPFALISGYATNKSLLAAGSISFGTSYSYTDATVESGKTYYYNLDWVDKDGTQKEVGGVLQVTASLPKIYALFQNYPNPFNPSTTIRFDLKQASTVVLDIYNILGEKVEESNYGTMNAGEYSKAFDMNRFASGVYFYRINALGNDGEKFVEMKKLVLMK